MRKNSSHTRKTAMRKAMVTPPALGSLKEGASYGDLSQSLSRFWRSSRRLANLGNEQAHVPHARKARKERETTH